MNADDMKRQIKMAKDDVAAHPEYLRTGSLTDAKALAESLNGWHGPVAKHLAEQLRVSEAARMRAEDEAARWETLARLSDGGRQQLSALAVKIQERAEKAEGEAGRAMKALETISALKWWYDESGNRICSAAAIQIADEALAATAPVVAVDEVTEKAIKTVRERLANNGRNPANHNAGIPVSGNLHLCEILLKALDRARGGA